MWIKSGRIITKSACSLCVCGHWHYTEEDERCRWGLTSLGSEWKVTRISKNPNSSNWNKKVIWQSTKQRNTPLQALAQLNLYIWQDTSLVLMNLPHHRVTPPPSSKDSIFWRCTAVYICGKTTKQTEWQYRECKPSSGRLLSDILILLCSVSFRKL